MTGLRLNGPNVIINGVRASLTQGFSEGSLYAHACTHTYTVHYQCLQSQIRTLPDFAEREPSTTLEIRIGTPCSLPPYKIVADSAQDKRIVHPTTMNQTMITFCREFRPKRVQFWGWGGDWYSYRVVLPSLSRVDNSRSTAEDLGSDFGVGR